MAKVTLLVPASSSSEQTRQMSLVIIILAKKPVVTSKEDQGRLLAFIMLAREAHNTMVDVELSRPTKAAGIKPTQIAEFRAFS
ncbi:hypothetical protein [Pantoea dispersa]|uniref:hypothetical protein n=1 Tax=Pantoea dispersa TaxID=59814 RepID=UPI001CA76FFC|nr:hypothetical protein [Pantoea dispersa]QZY95985.1 hypothetical protein K7X52_05975 [Pantoea dispersa]